MYLKGFIKKIKEDFQKSMIGRYGMDEYSKVLVCCGIFFLILSLIPKIHFIVILSVVFLTYAIFRCYSRNHIKRLDELSHFCFMKEKYGHRFSVYGGKYEDKKEIHVCFCRKCKVCVRVIKGKDQVIVKCPKCGEEITRREI